MPDQVVLVTGASRFIGSRLCALLTAEPSVEHVVGVDVVAPTKEIAELLGRTEFVRVDVRHPIIAKVISASNVDTVVHAGVIATPFDAGGRAAMKEANVIGTMQLLAACQKSASVKRLVVRSTTAVYGSSPQDPAIFTEDMEPQGLPDSGYAKDATEVEGYVRGFGRRRPDVDITVLRLTNLIGPTVETPLTRYLSLPVVPTVFGFDPRIQFCHEDDALDVLLRAALGAAAGTFNVGGDGVLLLSQALRRAGRPQIPVLPPAVTAVAQLLRQLRLVDYSPEQMHFLEQGRAVDTTAMRQVFGYSPRYTTSEAYDDFLRARLRPVIDQRWLHALEAGVLSVLSGKPADVGG